MHEDVEGAELQVQVPSFVWMDIPAIEGQQRRRSNTAQRLRDLDRSQLGQDSSVPEAPLMPSGSFSREMLGTPLLQSINELGRRDFRKNEVPFAKHSIALQLKRIGDILLAAASLILLAPLFLLIALAIKASSDGPVFFAHSRVGRDGKKFCCLKFRSMIETSDSDLDELLRDHPLLLFEWRQTRKLRHDPRITPLGHFLRRSSLDELPQLINILKGEMSFVGPRPVVEDELPRYGRSAVYYKRMKPGLTGLWQVSGRSSVCYNQRVALDRYYATRWSFMLDLSILARTIPAVLRYHDAS